MHRREILKLGSTLALASPLAPWSLAAGANDVPPRRLIVVFLRGAVDGLSVVAPYGDPAYAPARPGIALAPPGRKNGLLDLDGFFGLHPALAPLLPLWRDKALAFVHACGSPDPSRSHFDAQALMESGAVGHVLRDGWMNRLLAAMPQDPGGLAVGPTLPLILQGRAKAGNLDLNPGRIAGARDRPGAKDMFDRLYAGSPLGQAYAEGQATQAELQAGMAEEMTLANGGAPGPKHLAEDAARLAWLLRADPRIQLVFLPLGGWDTHVHQGNATGQLAQHLAQLGEGLAALAAGLGPELSRTVIVVLSEFGRTVRENGNGGTDHGHGNVLWLLGGPVAGGKVHGPWPGLDTGQLYEGRDLQVRTDYRQVLAAVLVKHLGMPAKTLGDIFPAYPEDNISSRYVHG